MITRITINISLMLLSSLVLAACATPQGTSTPSQPDQQTSKTSSATELVGKLWLLTSYRDNQGEIIQVLANTRPTIEFMDGRVTGNASCNSFFGSYQVVGDGLTIGEMGSTEKYCMAPEGIMDQESAFLAALQNTAKFQITEGELQIMNSQGEILLSFEKIQPIELTGVTWQVISYNNGMEAVVSIIPGSEITAQFKNDGSLSGFAGCNNYNAGYQTENGSIAIGPTASTMMFCADPEGVMDQESAYLAALSKAATYAIRDDVLEIRDENGALLAQYQAMPPINLAGTSWELIAYNNGKEAVVGVLNGTQITAEFAEDGQLSGSAGCNNYMASYQVEGETIQISPPASTRKMCSEPQGIMEQESAYLAALELAATFQATGDRLEIYAEDGARLLSYQMIDPATSEGTTP